MVIGASGFIGGALVRKLVKTHQVTALDKRWPTDRVKGVDYLLADITDPHAFNGVTSPIDVVFHFGAPSSQMLYNEKPVDCAIETMGGFVNVMEFARRTHAKTVVFPSSGTVYGDGQDGNTTPINLYGAMKLGTEHIARVYSKHFRLVGLRIFMGYGPGEEYKESIASPVCLFLTKMMNGERPVLWGTGDQTRDLIYIDDLVDIIVRSAKLKAPLTLFDTGIGIPASFSQMIDALNVELGTRIEPEYVAAPSNYLRSTLSRPTLAMKLLGRKPVLIEEGVRKFHRHLVKVGWF